MVSKWEQKKHRNVCAYSTKADVPLHVQSDLPTVRSGGKGLEVTSCFLQEHYFAQTAAWPKIAAAHVDSAR